MTTIPQSQPKIGMAEKEITIVLQNTVINITNVLLKESNTLPQKFQIEQSVIYDKSFINLSSSNVFSEIKDAIKKFNSIILIDTPLGISIYGNYEKFVVNLLRQIEPYKNVYISNDLYLATILKNIKKYKNIKGIYTTTYGVCVKENADITKLFNYYINLKTLHSMKPENVELVVQTNSICESTENISNTFGSELWLLDFLFQCSIGNVNTVVIETNNLNNLYAYNIFKMISGGKLYNTRYETKYNISCYITRNYQNYYVVVIHKDITIDVIDINVRLDVNNSGILYEFSCNQTILGTQGITFGKADYISNNYTGNTIVSNSGKYNFSIGTMKAYVLVVPITTISGGAFFENINNSDEKSTIITINPNPLTEEYDTVPTTMNLRNFKKEYLSDY